MAYHKIKVETRKPLTYCGVEAEKVGLVGATLLHRIKYWVKFNAVNKTNNSFNENRYWTYNTVGDINGITGFSVSQVRTGFKKLESQGFIKVGNFNRLGFDRTKWYTLSDTYLADFTNPYAVELCSICGISQFDLIEQTIRIAENDQTIPVIEEDILNSSNKAYRVNNTSSPFWMETLSHLFLETDRNYFTEPHLLRDTVFFACQLYAQLKSNNFKKYLKQLLTEIISSNTILRDPECYLHLPRNLRFEEAFFDSIINRYEKQYLEPYISKNGKETLDWRDLLNSDVTSYLEYNGFVDYEEQKEVIDWLLGKADYFYKDKHPFQVYYRQVKKFVEAYRKYKS